MTTIDAEEEMNSATASSFGNLTQDHTVVLAGTRGGGASSSHRLSVSRVALLSAHPCAIPCHVQAKASGCPSPAPMQSTLTALLNVS